MYVLSCTKFVLWMSILTYVFVWAFVMRIFVRMTVHILMNFRHVRVCTNDYQFPCVQVFVKAHFCTNDYQILLNRFTSCTCLYEWLSISLCIGFLHEHFCTNNHPYHLNGFSTCTCLYEWLSISFQWVFVDYPLTFEWIFVIYISVWMTNIYLWMDCRHLHFCTNDYHLFLNGLSSFTFLYEWIPCLFEWIVVIYISLRMNTISFWMDCRHLHFCTNDYNFFLKGLSSFIFLYEWLPFLLNRFLSWTFLFKWLQFIFEWIFVMHISLWMTNIAKGSKKKW